MKGKVSGIFIVLICFQLHANEVIQFHGLVLDDSTDEPLEFVNIILNHKKGTISDRFGRFSFLVHRQDTVIFSSMGFKRDTVIIPDTLKEPFYQAEVALRRDTIAIDSVVILPWKNYKEFKEAFLELDLPNDDLERARKNIALIKTQMKLEGEPNPEISFDNMMKKQYHETFTYGEIYPYISLLDPIAWAKFFKALREGDFRDNE